MQRKSVSLSLVALAALFAGCEWTSTHGSDSWSGSYDAMNFGGTYRITSVSMTSNGGEGGENHASDWTTIRDEGGGTFAGGTTTASGKTTQHNIVPGSVKISCGNYVWVDNGSGGLSFGGGSSSGGSGEGETGDEYSGTETIGTLSNDQTYSYKIQALSSGYKLVAGSVSVRIGNSAAFQDNGTGSLVASGVHGSGSVNYESGVVAFTLDTTGYSGQKATVSFKYTSGKGASIGTGEMSGSGTILYSSGAWTLAVSPKMPSSNAIRVTYSYYTGGATTYTGIDITNFDPNTVTAITVTQTGQNLTMSFNNGIVLSGKFTSVRQTGQIDEDTGAGANTYNAQFQVNSGNESKMVGTLSYDYPTHNRLLDGTWSLNRKVFDVHATGPAWTESGTTTAADTTYTK